jgi:hypothetical protein
MHEEVATIRATAQNLSGYDHYGDKTMCSCSTTVPKLRRIWLRSSAHTVRTTTRYFTYSIGKMSHRYVRIILILSSNWALFFAKEIWTPAHRIFKSFSKRFSHDSKSYSTRKQCFWPCSCYCDLNVELVSIGRGSWLRNVPWLFFIHNFKYLNA